MDAVYLLIGVIFFALAAVVVERAFPKGEAVIAWYIVCAVLALLLLAYLFVAMLKPEWF